MFGKLRELIKPTRCYDFVLVDVHELTQGKTDQALAELMLAKALADSANASPLDSGFDPNKIGDGLHDMQTDCVELKEEVLRLCRSDKRYKRLKPYFIHNFTAGFFREVNPTD